MLVLDLDPNYLIHCLIEDVAEGFDLCAAILSYPTSLWSDLQHSSWRTEVLLLRYGLPKRTYSLTKILELSFQLRNVEDVCQIQLQVTQRDEDA